MEVPKWGRYVCLGLDHREPRSSASSLSRRPSATAFPVRAACCKHGQMRCHCDRQQEGPARKKAEWLIPNIGLPCIAMDDQLNTDAEVLFRLVGHKFDNNPMAPAVFKDVITASDRSDGHIFGPGFFCPDTCHAYWFHGFQFVCDKFGKIGLVLLP